MNEIRKNNISMDVKEYLKFALAPACIGFVMGGIAGVGIDCYKINQAKAEYAAEQRAYSLDRMPLKLAEMYMAHPEKDISATWK